MEHIIMEANKNLTVMEKELISHLTKMHETMVELSTDDLMTEEALRVLSKEQVVQYELFQKIIAQVSCMMKIKYISHRVTHTATTQKKKKITEKEKREGALLHPELFFICDRCDRIFVSKRGRQEHQKETVICRLIKTTKQGLLEEHNISKSGWGMGERSTGNITRYIANKIDGNDTEEEEAEEEARVARIQEEEE